MWNTFVERVDEDTMSMNNRVDQHHALLDNFLKFCRNTEELIGRYKSHFEHMEAALVEKSQYIEMLETNLAILTLRVNTMEDRLCHCGDWEVPQEVQEDDAQSELSYVTQEYHTPPMTTMRIIEGPLAIVPVGDLEVTQGGFDKEVRDALGARMHLSRVYMVITL